MSISAARLYASIALVAGPLIALLTPPLQVPDEGAHWLRAWQISDGRWMGERRGDLAGGEVPGAIVRSFGRFGRMQTDANARASMREIGRWVLDARREPQDLLFFSFPNTVRYAPVPYLPAAAGLALARGARAGVGVGFYAARFATLLAAVALIAFSLAGAPASIAWPLALLALLPMSQALFSSLSADAITLALAIANVAAAARLAWAAVDRPGPRIAWLAATALLLALTKPIFAPFGCVTALAAAAPYPARRWRILLLAGAVPLLAGAVWLVLSQPVYVPLQPGLSVQAQKAWMLSHPAAATAALVRAVFYWRLANQFIGVLGWLDAPVPIWIRVVLAPALLLIPLAASGLRLPGFIRWATVLSALGLMLLTGLANQLTWTRPGAAQIEGMQGRYYLPLYALALLAVPPLPFFRRFERHVPLATAAACLLGTGGAVYTLLHRYWWQA